MAAITPADPVWFNRRRPTSADTLQATLADVVELLGGAPDATARSSVERFAIHRIARGATLIHEGAAADALYVVQSGSFKSVKTAEDGYEHVLGFAWRRDVLGYDGLGGARYAFAAVALEDSRAIALQVGALPQLRHRVPELDAMLQSHVARQLAHAGEIAEVMSAVAADVRLARFLIQLSQRMAACGQSPRRLLLRMSRRDIANHLGLAHETISRSLRVLSEHGCLHVDNRELEILDPQALRRFARSTRGLPEGIATTVALACAA